MRQTLRSSQTADTFTVKCTFTFISSILSMQNQVQPKMFVRKTQQTSLFFPFQSGFRLIQITCLV
jgi:hypothetical protein